jgi:glycosyltransferase involved in cell wall biosynthesis/ribosomal protein S18 acetylase RimI-like enzyme
MRIAHLTTIDMSLRYLVLPQLEAARDIGEAIGISAPGEFTAELEARGIRHAPLVSSTRSMNLVSDLRAAAQLWRVLRRLKPDVLHTHNPKPGFYGRILGRASGVPIVVNTVHGLYATAESSLRDRLTVYAMEWLASRFSDAELVQNPEDVEVLRRLHITPSGKIRLLGNGVDLVRFNPEHASAARSSARAELGVGPKQIVVGFVGRLVAEKGIPELIEAARRLPTDYTVMVVGPLDRDKEDALDDDTIELAERAGVRILGMRPDVDRLYGSFDVFVLPSHREGFPRAAMEAAASGLPVIATDIRGCRQVVEDGVTGRLVRVGDVDGLVAAIEEIGSDHALRSAMGAASVAKARVEFDEREVVEKVMATYRDVANRRGLGWLFPAGNGASITVRTARPQDASAIAELHRQMIGSGFLASLGTGFLTVLYQGMMAAPQSRVLVGEGDGVVRGFVAGVANTDAFFAWFLRNRALPAIWHSLLALSPRAISKVLETWRYGNQGHEGVPAELLALAIAPSARGRGLGTDLVAALLDWAGGEDIDAMRVVLGADNEAARRLYAKCGFTGERRIEIHHGEPSLEMVWSR